MRGFINEFMRIFVWIGSAFGAYYVYFYQPQLLTVLPSMNGLLTLIFLFICFLIASKLLQTLLDKSIKITPLNFINQPLGFAYGLLRGLAIILSIGHTLDRFQLESQFICQLYEQSAPYIDLRQQEDNILQQGKKIAEKFEKEFMKK